MFVLLISIFKFHCLSQILKSLTHQYPLRVDLPAIKRQDLAVIAVAASESAVPLPHLVELFQLICAHVDRGGQDKPLNGLSAGRGRE